MEVSEIRAKMTELFQEIFDDDTLSLKDDMTAADIAGWDSMKMVMIVIAVQKRFGIKTSSRDVDKLSCVGDFIALIQSKLK